MTKTLLSLVNVTLLAILTWKALIVGLISLGMLSGVGAEVWAEARIEEQAVGLAGQGITNVVSPRGVHLASITMQGSRYVVVIDGEAGPKVDQILLSNGGPFYPA